MQFTAHPPLDGIHQLGSGCSEAAQLLQPLLCHRIEGRPVLRSCHDHRVAPHATMRQGRAQRTEQPSLSDNHTHGTAFTCLISLSVTNQRPVELTLMLNALLPQPGKLQVEDAQLHQDIEDIVALHQDALRPMQSSSCEDRAACSNHSHLTEIRPPMHGKAYVCHKLLFIGKCRSVTLAVSGQRCLPGE
jgi:hypothetical protein